MTTTVNKKALAAIMLVGVVALILMYLGNGEALTFGGVGLFVIFMWQITRISLNAIEKQDQRFKETRQEIADGDE